MFLYVSSKKTTNQSRKTPLLFCSRNKACPWCCSVFGVHLCYLNCFSHSHWEVSPGKSRPFLGQHRVPGSSCGSADAVPGPTEVISHLQGLLGGESWWQKTRPGLERANLCSVCCFPSGAQCGSHWFCFWWGTGSSWILSGWIFPGSFWWIFRSWLSRSTQVCHKQKIL